MAQHAATDVSGSALGSTHTVRDSIVLTPAERELFDILIAAAKHAGTGTVLRCAGGWVRDKLLGKGSDDIDIALDNMLGKDFADKVNEYLTSIGRESRHTAVIQSNPDQSKHLETARMKIGDVWIDLVNLRSETYAADSRIPEMAFGTPEQDALRRDFTINAMFYNLNTGAVEDLTGRGMQDLRDGIIRTPLQPTDTFLDDPLRVLRAVRFGTRFGFRLEHDILQAAASEQVRAALGSKVSRERVGTELEGMFHGPAPVAAVQLLQRLHLFPVVFALPPPLSSQAGLADAYGSAGVACMAAAHALMTAQGMQLGREELRYLLLASLLAPLRALQHRPSKGKPQAAPTAVIRDSIKWRAKDAEVTQALHEAAPHLLALHARIAHNTDSSAAGGGEVASGSGSSVAVAETPVPVVLGNVIRNLRVHWRLGVLLAPVLSMRAAAPLGATGPGDTLPPAGGFIPGGAGPGYEEELTAAAGAARLEVARSLLAAAGAYGLEEAWQWRSLLTGPQVMELLGIAKAGPELGRLIAGVMDWQLAHPQGGAEECGAALKEAHAKAAAGKQ